MLKDYESYSWELKENIKNEALWPNVYRDLTKHTGNMSDKKAQSVIDKYTEEKRDGDCESFI